MVVLMMAAWLGWVQIAKLAEATAVQHLNENGLYPRYAARSWSPWRGLHLERLVLYRNIADHEPVIEISALAATFPWRRIWKTREFFSHWHLQSATVTLHDAAGAVTFSDVTSNVALHGGEIDVSQLQFSEGAIAAFLSGKVLFAVPQRPLPQNPQDFVIDLGVVRAVLAALDIKAGSGPFFVHGTFAVDCRHGAGSWEANLRGNGKEVVWRDILLPDVDTQAQLSQKGLNLAGDLRLTHGVGTFKATREDWDRSPLVVTGLIADPAGRRDELSASYNGASHTMMLASIRGKANLLEFARSFPALARILPTGIEVRNVPEISLTKLLYREGKGSWSLGSLELQSPADITLAVGMRPLAIDHLAGHAAFDGHAWRFGDVSGSFAGGHFTIAGAYVEAEVRDASLELSSLPLKELGPWLGEGDGAFGKARLSLDYHGTLGIQAARWTGSGSVRLESAPVVKVPLLDETYALFGALSSGVKRSGTGDFNASFTASQGVFNVTRFTATGEAVTVTGSGVVDLVRRQVDGRARGNLRGIPGLATSVFGKALELRVSGPLDHIRVQPLSPLELLGQGAGGAAELPGTVLKDGVTLPIKIFDWLGGNARFAQPRTASEDVPRYGCKPGDGGPGQSRGDGPW